MAKKIKKAKPPKKDKSQEIIAAAIESLATQGWENTTFDSLGKELGMQRTHVAYYFPTKRELMEAVMAHISANAQRMTIEQVMRATTPQETVRAIVASAFDWADAFPKHAKVMGVFYHLCAIDSGLRKKHSEIRAVGLNRLSVCMMPFSNVTDAEKANAHRVAHHVQSLITGKLFEYFATEPLYSLKDLKEQTLEVTSLLIANLKGTNQQ